MSRDLHIWLVGGRVAHALLPGLLRKGAVAGVERNHVLAAARSAATPDPLLQFEWWRSHIGADAAVPPGPGVPITVIDEGVDVTHPEFQGAHLTLLNAQVPTDPGDEGHGTAVTSVAAAPVNGIGVVGVYPDANVWEWDARSLTDADVIAGLDAAWRRGKSVINISLGSTTYDSLLEQATLRAFGTGSVIVAAAGNEFEQGNPVTYPASLNHILTVAATDEGDRAAYFSNANDAVDLAAPGQDIVVALPLGFNRNGYDVWDGTSFAAPMVAAATAWVWTQRPDLDRTQIFDLMRYSARDLRPEGFDADTGFGLLDIPGALRAPAPSADRSEPNDDIYMVRKNGLFASADTPLTRPGHGRGGLSARLDYTEDPEDVYRVYVPAHRTVTVRVKGNDNVDLELWRLGTKSVYERGTALRRDLIQASTRRGTVADTVGARNSGRRGTYVYADVYLGKDTADAAYGLTVSTSRR